MLVSRNSLIGSREEARSNVHVSYPVVLGFSIFNREIRKRKKEKEGGREKERERGIKEKEKETNAAAMPRVPFSRSRRGVDAESRRSEIRESGFKRDSAIQRSRH